MPDHSAPPRKLLVLDLDETLVHAREDRLEHDEDFRVGPYYVYRRPHLEKFVQTTLERYDVGVWTASGELYASQVINRIFPAGALKFVWSSKRCTVARNWTTGEYETIKNLSKLKKQGYALDSILAIDDTPSKYARSFGNLVAVREFVGDRSDNELPLLLQYLESLHPVENVRTVEKRRWQERLLQRGTSVA